MSDFRSKSTLAYNKMADNYDNSFEGRFTRKFINLLLDTIWLEEKMNVLDVACGNGTLLFGLNQKKEINGFGVDIAEQMIKNAAGRNPNMKFYTAGCEALPLENDTMDIMTVCAAYHHFPDVAAFAKEAQRVLKAGGKIYIAEIYVPALLRIICNPFVPLSKSGDVRFYSMSDIVRQFEIFGFECVDTGKKGIVQRIVMQKKRS